MSFFGRAFPGLVRSSAALFVASGVALVPSFANAAPLEAPGEVVPAPTEAQIKAQEHFKRARELYQVGTYREAQAELEAALALDPNAKDLLFNLGIVSEKLGKFDDALRYFRRYTEMDLSPAEKQRADGFIKRLEGAKNEVVPTPPPAPPPEPPKREPPPPENGRIDLGTILAGSVAIAGIGAGTVFAIKALADKPRPGFVTGRDGSYTDLQRAADTAHTEAMIADVGFGVGIVAAALTAYLYFSRPKIVPLSPTAPTRAASTSLSVTPAPGGGALLLRGSF